MKSRKLGIYVTLLGLALAQMGCKDKPKPVEPNTANQNQATVQSVSDIDSTPTHEVSQDTIDSSFESQLSKAYDYYFDARKRLRGDRIGSTFAVNRAIGILEKTQRGIDNRLYDECTYFRDNLLKQPIKAY